VTQRWVFVRHGESVANRDGWLAGHVDTPLTERGRAQAVEAGRGLVDLDIGVAWSSDLVRAIDTAAIALDGRMPVGQSAALRERYLGDWAHRDRAQMRASGMLRGLATWTGAAPGGESQADMAARLVPWCAAQPPVSGVILVVAHGGVLRVLTGLLDDVPLDQIGSRVVDNGVALTRDVTPQQWAHLLAQHA
jgi:broad specificity phosphatase PhoE